MKKVIVCGGRIYADRYFLYEQLDIISEGQPMFIIQGGATGADALARDWARVRGCPCAEVAADWGFYGKSAGPRRNGWMLELKPDLVIAFPGKSGTRNMVAKAEAAGVPVISYES